MSHLRFRYRRVGVRGLDTPCLSLALGIFCGSTAVSWGAETARPAVPRWQPHDFTFTVRGAGNNPFQVGLSTTVKGPDGQTFILSGLVLPVGGVKEKVLAAHRAGITDVILPAQNEAQVKEDLKSEQLDGLQTHYVKTVEDVIAVVLEPKKARKKPADRRPAGQAARTGKRRPAAARS